MPGSTRPSATHLSFERLDTWTVPRSLCPDLIRREVERTLTSAPPLRLYNKEADLVRSYFKANGLWTDLKRQFSIPNAGKAIHELTGEALTKLIIVALFRT